MISIRSSQTWEKSQSGCLNCGHRPPREKSEYQRLTFRPITNQMGGKFGSGLGGESFNRSNLWGQVYSDLAFLTSIEFLAKVTYSVIPAKAGIQKCSKILDSGSRFACPE